MKMTDHPLYYTWNGMKSRCYTTGDPNYKHYGGRGIYICDRWLNNFWAFVEDMNDKPGPEYSIDRIDNDGPYSPENCRWATQKEQANNMRTTTHITFQGETHTITEWAEILGIDKKTIDARLNKLQWPIDKVLSTENYSKKILTFKGVSRSITEWADVTNIFPTTIRHRLYIANWSIEKTLTTPAKNNARLLTYNGKTQSVSDWAREYGLSVGTLFSRLRNQWSVERALTTPVQKKSK